MEPVEQSRERLRRVDGVEDDTLRAREAHDRVELLRAHLPAPRALVAVEQPDLRRRLDGERVAAARFADDARHVVADARGFPRDGHADDVPAQPVELLRHEQPRLAPAAEGGDHDRVEVGRAVADLLGELLAARDVTEGARDGRAALGDDVGRAAAPPHARRQLLEHLVDARPLRVRAGAQLGPEQAGEEQVAVELRGRRALEREDRPETEARRDRGDRAAAVGLERAAGDQRVGALGQRLADEELELPDLVARLDEPREIVALHPHLDAQLLGQALELEQRRRRVGELDARDRRGARHHDLTISGEEVARQGAGRPLGRSRGLAQQAAHHERILDGIVAVVVECGCC